MRVKRKKVKNNNNKRIEKLNDINFKSTKAFGVR